MEAAMGRTNYDFSHNAYESEARERWGDSSVNESSRRLGNLSSDEMEMFSERMSELFTSLASLREGDPGSAEVQDYVDQWYRMLNTIGFYSPQMFAGLGDLYTDDPRFAAHFEAYGEGLACFLRDAIHLWVEQIK